MRMLHVCIQKLIASLVPTSCEFQKGKSQMDGQIVNPAINLSLISDELPVFCTAPPLLLMQLLLCTLVKSVLLHSFAKEFEHLHVLVSSVHNPRRHFCSRSNPNEVHRGGATLRASVRPQ